MAEDPKVLGNTSLPKQVPVQVPPPAKTNVPAQTPAKSSPSSNISTPMVKDDYIPPPQRRLGPHENALNLPFSSVESTDPVTFQLRKIVGLLVATSKHAPGFSGEFLDEATQLAAQFMSRVVSALHKLTEVQRHLRPGLADLEMCLLDHGIAPTDLHSEYLRTKSATAATRKALDRVARDLDVLLREYNANNYTLDKDDASLVFHANEQHEIAGLVPRQATRRDYIPSYLPDLPPDFTFTLTGHYMPTTTDLKQIKLRLAEETRLNEASLYRLIDDDERRWRQALERDLSEIAGSEDEESADDEIMSPAADKTVTDIETPDPGEAKVSGEKHPLLELGKDLGHGLGQESGKEPEKKPAQELTTGDPGKRFDFVEYARKRRAARERYGVEMEKRRTARHADVFMRAEAIFSPYATKPPLETDREFFSGVLNESFKRAIKATRAAEKKKQRRLARIAEERKKREAEQAEQNGAFEFGFAFNPAANILDDSDDSDDDIGPAAGHTRGTSPEFEFDFGDAGEPETPQAKGDDMDEDTAMEDVESEHPLLAQVSGKAPLKAPIELRELVDRLDQERGQEQGHSDIEDELEQHFGLEDEDDDEDEGEELENVTSLGTDQVPGSTDGSHQEISQQNQPTTHVLWGDLGSEESEEDELEDIE